VLNVGGLTPCTTIDYPDHLAAVVFCRGCPWRCSYCHNRELIDGNGHGAIPWDEVLSLLDRRGGLLDAVVFSGGEPTLQPALKEAVISVRKRGFLTGLHTAGAFPEMLREVLPHLDWVGMDIKAPFPDYERITGIGDSGEKAEQSARLVRESGVAHEFRTTLDPFLMKDNRIRKLQQLISHEWKSAFRIQALSGMESRICAE
jgi:pyruvate formate lyase activating enzyme